MLHNVQFKFFRRGRTNLLFHVQCCHIEAGSEGGQSLVAVEGTLFISHNFCLMMPWNSRRHCVVFTVQCSLIKTRHPGPLVSQWMVAPAASGRLIWTDGSENSQQSMQGISKQQVMQMQAPTADPCLLQDLDLATPMVGTGRGYQFCILIKAPSVVLIVMHVQDLEQGIHNQ